MASFLFSGIVRTRRGRTEGEEAVITGPRTATPLTKQEVPALAARLAMEGLPNQDIADAGRRFWRVDDPDGLLGYGGLEVHGRDGLLRSVVVPPDIRASAQFAGLCPGSAVCPRRDLGPPAEGTASAVTAIPPETAPIR